jgi:putative phosphoesterase
MTHTIYTAGVIADTHIPDRVTGLHPMILPTLEARGVQHILHAGDICVGRVLDELRQVAPVTAVRGNRDMLAGSLRLVEHLDLGGVPVALTHGHGGLRAYLLDKLQYLRHGYRLERYLDLLARAGGPAMVVVFGHTHHPETLIHSGRLLFNPGSASIKYRAWLSPTIGLLHIDEGGQVRTELVPLEGYQIVNRQWVPR